MGWGWMTIPIAITRVHLLATWAHGRRVHPIKLDPRVDPLRVRVASYVVFKILGDQLQMPNCTMKVLTRTAEC